MNDAELDRLLDVWKAPAPPPSLRQGLRAQFPRPEPRRFSRRRWLVLLLAVAATLAIGMEAARPHSWSSAIVQFLSEVYEGVTGTIETWPASRIVAKVRNSDPQVYVDGQPGATLKYHPLVGPWGEARMDVQVPGEGVFSITTHDLRDADHDWTEAGRIHDSVIEFQAGRKSVRIVCNKPIVDKARPLFVRKSR